MSPKSYSDDQPPPYTPAAPLAGHSSSPASGPLTLDPKFFSQTLRTHLSTLPNRIQSTSARNQTKQIAADLAIISLLVPVIESFLSAAAQRAARATSGSTSPAGPMLGSLTLVPAAAVPTGAEMGDLRERRREGEFARVVRVEPEGSFFGGQKSAAEKGAPATGDVKKSANDRRLDADEADGHLRSWDPERDEYFDSWGRFGPDAAGRTSRGAGAGGGEDDCDGDGGWDTCSEQEQSERRMMWWNDEDTALRLASYLQPAPIAQKKLERKEVRRAVTGQLQLQQNKKKESKKSSWLGLGKGKKADGSAPKKVEEIVVIEEAGVSDENVNMLVQAEELSFQRENEVGIYESIRGWGILIRLKIYMS